MEIKPQEDTGGLEEAIFRDCFQKCYQQKNKLRRQKVGRPCEARSQTSTEDRRKTTNSIFIIRCEQQAAGREEEEENPPNLSPLLTAGEVSRVSIKLRC